jgi:magnesium transporter
MTLTDLCQTFLENHTAEAARSLERQAPAQVTGLLAELPPDVVAMALGSMDPFVSVAIFEALPLPVQGEVVSRLDPHKASGFLRRVNVERVDPILQQLSSDTRRILERLLAYPENTVGAIMDPRYPCLPEDISLSEALGRVQADTDRTCLFWFTVDREQSLTGVLSIRDLLSPDRGQQVAEVRQTCPDRLSALTDVATLRSSAEFRRLNALPVTDERNVYLGAVRQEAIVPLEEPDQLKGSIQVAGSALGELYRLGLSGLVYSLDQGADKRASSLGDSR